MCSGKQWIALIRDVFTHRKAAEDAKLSDFYNRRGTETQRMLTIYRRSGFSREFCVGRIIDSMTSYYQLKQDPRFRGDDV